MGAGPFMGLPRAPLEALLVPGEVFSGSTLALPPLLRGAFEFWWTTRESNPEPLRAKQR